MARTKQTARKTERPGEPSQAHSLLKAVAAAQAFERIKQNIRRRRMESERPTNEEQHQEGETNTSNIQKHVEGDKEQDTEHQREDQEENPQGNPLNEQQKQADQGETEQQQGEENIFSGLGNINASAQQQQTGQLLATRTPLPTFDPPRNLTEDQAQRILEEQQIRRQEEEAEAQALAAAQEAANKLMHDADQSRIDEEINRLAAERLAADLERRSKTARRQKECAKRKRVPSQQAQYQGSRQGIPHGTRPGAPQGARQGSHVAQGARQGAQPSARQGTNQGQGARQGTTQAQAARQGTTQAQAARQGTTQGQGQGSQQPQGGHHEDQASRQEKRKKFRNDRPSWERRPPPPRPPQAKRPYKFKPGTVALREIRKYQKSTDFLIPRAPFVRLVREVIAEMSDRVDRVGSQALGALQEALEDIIVSVFQDTVCAHIHAKRVTAKPVDMALALRIRQEDSLRKDH